MDEAHDLFCGFSRCVVARPARFQTDCRLLETDPKSSVSRPTRQPTLQEISQQAPYIPTTSCVPGRRPPGVPRVPPGWINGPLYLLSRAEQRTLGAIGAPFGSTLMVCCAKCQA